MPSQSRHKPAPPPVTPKAEEPVTPKPTTPCLPRHRSESIGSLTAKARLLEAEQAEIRAKVDAHNYRDAAISRELAEIRKQVLEHAWDGIPPADQVAY
jgi:hypothetical protein